MNQADLVVAAAERARLTKAVEALVGTITEALKQGEEVRIAGFGTFGISERGERQGGNPQTGSPIRIAASKADTVGHFRTLTSCGIWDQGGEF